MPGIALQYPIGGLTTAPGGECYSYPYCVREEFMLREGQLLSPNHTANEWRDLDQHRLGYCETDI